MSDPVPVEKRYREIQVDPTEWTRVTNADGSHTYTCSAAGALLKIDVDGGGRQEHTAGVADTFTTQAGCIDLWGMY